MVVYKLRLKFEVAFTDMVIDFDTCVPPLSH